MNSSILSTIFLFIPLQQFQLFSFVFLANFLHLLFQPIKAFFITADAAPLTFYSASCQEWLFSFPKILKVQNTCIWTFSKNADNSLLKCRIRKWLHPCFLKCRIRSTKIFITKQVSNIRMLNMKWKFRLETLTGVAEKPAGKVVVTELSTIVASPYYIKFKLKLVSANQVEKACNILLILKKYCHSFLSQNTVIACIY